MKSKLSGAKISYKKMRIIADIVRGRKVTDATARLRLMPKKSAKIMEKVISSAAANAENNANQKKDDLVVESVVINKGSVMKRWRPISRGRAHPYRKQTSNITVTLAPEIQKETKKKKAAKTEVKEKVAKDIKETKKEEKKPEEKKTEKKSGEKETK